MQDTVTEIKTWRLSERAGTPDFYIRNRFDKAPIDRPHRHAFFQIHLNLKGDTEQSVGGAVRPFRPGYLSFVLPYKIHHIPYAPGSHFLVIGFSPEFLFPRLDIDPLDLADVPIERAPLLAPFLYQEDMDFIADTIKLAEFRALGDRMLNAYERGGFAWQDIVRGCLAQMIGSICAQYEADFFARETERARRASRHHALERVTRYIRANLTHELSLTEAAEAAYLSPNYLAHMLKKETGMTFTQLVTDRRLRRAQELLIHTNQRIAEIAYACGFSDEAYFARRFKQWFGAPPRTFREDARAHLPDQKIPA